MVLGPVEPKEPISEAPMTASKDTLLFDWELDLDRIRILFHLDHQMIITAIVDERQGLRYVIIINQCQLPVCL